MISSRQRRFVVKFVRLCVSLFDWTQPTCKIEVCCESGVCELKSAHRLVQFFLVDTFEEYFENNNNFIE